MGRKSKGKIILSIPTMSNSIGAHWMSVDDVRQSYLRIGAHASTQLPQRGDFDHPRPDIQINQTASTIIGFNGVAQERCKFI
jgi:hypothetical protein